MTAETEQFHDINKFPKGWGLIVFPISMTRIPNAQSPENCFAFLDELTSKISEPRVGISFLYTEGLYMNMPGGAYELKNSYIAKIVSHSNRFRKLLRQNPLKFQIQDAFCFESWFQMCLAHPDFSNVLSDIKKFYAQDEKFQKYMQEDAITSQKELNEYQISFFIEEHAMAYLILNQQLKIRNDFVRGQENWSFIAYPGFPLKAQIYLFQKDPLKISGLSKNPYKGHYDLSTKKFIDYTKFVLDA